MYQTFNGFIFFFLIVISLGICEKSNTDLPVCTICKQVLIDDYLKDAWENPFHTHHKNDGIFCNSCSRIISQGITHGGFRYTDGRHLCSLCQISVVENDSIIQAAYTSIISQFDSIGIHNIPRDIPIELINLIELNEKFGQSHGKLKGFTQTKRYHDSQLSFTIFILFGLPQIEFEAVLAHELMHVWLYRNYHNLPIETVEGLCNLGSALIYRNDGTHFSHIHLKAMQNNPHTIYGDGYRRMKIQLEKLGWDCLIKQLTE